MALKAQWSDCLFDFFFFVLLLFLFKGTCFSNPPILFSRAVFFYVSFRSFSVFFRTGSEIANVSKSAWSALILSNLPLVSLLLLLLSACPSGYFKPTQGDESCLQCPINSRTTSEGAMNCVCRNGYYRTDSDPLQMPCTST